jgi:hypothetical protein
MDSNRFSGYPSLGSVYQASTTLPSSAVTAEALMKQPYNLVIPVHQSGQGVQQTGLKAKSDKSKNPAIFECDIFGCNAAFKTKFSL